jgi:hypothetical protein
VWKGATKSVTRISSGLYKSRRSYVRYQECYEGVTRTSQECYKSGIRVLQECYKGATVLSSGSDNRCTHRERNSSITAGFMAGVLQGHDKGVTRVLRGRYKDMTRVLQECYEGVTRT